MDSPEEETSRFERVTCILGSLEQDITDAGVLSHEIIEQVLIVGSYYSSMIIVCFTIQKKNYNLFGLFQIMPPV